MLVIGIKFKSSNKVYWFNPAGADFVEGDGVIVETARGIEYGKCVSPNKDVPDKDVVQPLKDVLRKATREDEEQIEKNIRMRSEALPKINEVVRRHRLDMKVVDCEYTFDRAKLICYFTADGRVDFRDLVKELASVFRARIELRQIYERDDTKMRGALASCGRECCCSAHLPDFEKVSIKMAKLQGLSLNPQKISGVCGRLMCCLKYENDYYAKVFKTMPKLRSSVRTPDGEGIVESNDIIKQTTRVKVLLKDGSYDIRTYPLADLKIKSKQEEPSDTADD
ncbi:MAG: stage 0 sporulation family protein [Clostridiaceae bacterium]|jgi:cell fate regulator YaaT (PSP1 superfamily)|nr:stage 0 sporulation family protein [Clostridiaceae bacterium]